MDDPGAVRPCDREAAIGRELRQRVVAGNADGAGFGETAGQDEEIADTAVGRLANRVEDGIGAYDDDGEVDGWVDGADRCHRFVSEDRPASGIDRNDATAISGLAQHLHDSAARRRCPLARADHGNAAGREERREIAGGNGHGVPLQHRRRGRTRWPIRSNF